MPYFYWRGYRLHYRERGNWPLLLVLPGNTASSACHEGELAHFCARYHAVSVDFLGTGHSERVAVWDSLWWEQGAAQARALVEHLRCRDCIVVGTSGGAVVGLLMAILFPETVLAVVADSTALGISTETWQTIVLPDRIKRTDGQVAFWRQAHGPDWAQVVDADTDLIRRFVEGGGDWFHGRLSQVRCPVLLTASRRDPLLPQITPQLCEMAAQIDGCRAYLHHDGGHPLMWSRPQVFRTFCDHFLEDVAGRGQ